VYAAGVRIRSAERVELARTRQASESSQSEILPRIDEKRKANGNPTGCPLAFDINIFLLLANRINQIFQSILNVFNEAKACTIDVRAIRRNQLKGFAV